jgi:hypothetical protein
LLVELLTSPQPVLSQEELSLISKEIDRHIETEAQMVNFVGEIINKVDYARAKLILSDIQ